VGEGGKWRAVITKIPSKSHPLPRVRLEGDEVKFTKLFSSHLHLTKLFINVYYEKKKLIKINNVNND